jgi:hypothetical protein
MNARSSLDFSVLNKSLDLRLETSSTAGASSRALRFGHLSIETTYDLPLNIGDFNISRWDGTETGLTIQRILTNDVSLESPDRGAKIGLLIAIHMRGESMLSTEVTAWFDSLNDESYLYARLEYQDGSHQAIELLESARPNAKSSVRYQLPKNPTRVLWLSASPEVLLLGADCAVSADA